jgi:hypothetical protein
MTSIGWLLWLPNALTCWRNLLITLPAVMVGEMKYDVPSQDRRLSWHASLPCQGADFSWRMSGYKKTLSPKTGPYSSVALLGCPQAATCIDNKGNIPHCDRDTHIHTQK